jgi:hypothetical protein
MRARRLIMLGALLAAGTALLSARTPASTPAELRSSGSGLVRSTSVGPAKVTIEADRTELNPAQQVHLTITASVPGGYSVTLPAANAKLGDFAVATRADDPPKLIGGRISRSVSVTLDPFLPGDYMIPALDIAYSRIGGGESGTLKTEPMTFHVSSLLTADAKLEPGPARGVVPPPVARSGWMMPAMIGGLSVALAGAITTGLALRRRRSATGPGSAEALATLRDRAGSGEVSLRGVCDEAPQLVRRAFARRITRPEAMTTEELLGAAPQSGITAHELERVRDFLHACDAARFAGEEADREQLLNGLTAMAALAAGLERPLPAGGAA